MDMKSSRWRDLAMIGSVALLYFCAAKFGLSLAFVDKQVTAVWPPTGIALVALLLLGYRAWPGIALGAFLINAVAGSPFTALGLAAGNTLEAVVGAYLLRRVVGFDNSLERLRDVFGLVFFSALISTMVSATFGVTSLCLGGLPWAKYGPVWWVWWLGDAMGALVVAPLLLTWAARPRMDWRGWRVLEAAALFAALLGVSQLVFSGHFVTTTSHYQLEYLVFPFVIWAALRFGQRETAMTICVVSAFAIWGAIHGRGPFSMGTFNERLIMLQTFMFIVAVTALSLGAVTAERRQTQGTLRQTLDQLEIRVQERTADLAKANAILAQKNEEVEAFVYIVSHDLRAPLVNLQGFSKELENSCQELNGRLHDAALPADVNKSIGAIVGKDIPDALRYISTSTNKFQRLIDALLMLSRSGRQVYRLEDLDIAAVVGATLDSMRQSIEKSGARIKLDLLPHAWGDQTAVGQIFSNLIGNALKYLQPGRPGLIEVGGERQNGMNHFWVRDNGAGIPKTAEGRLFQVFQRFHPALASGEGMGLATVKRIVERHCGRIWVESEEGTGSVFHWTLPAASPIAVASDLSRSAPAAERR